MAGIVAEWTGIPVGRLMQGENEKLLTMESYLGKRVIGQKEAIQAVSDAVRRSRAGISDPNRPTGSFLFLGPTGVGKTELAKALADFLFDDEKAVMDAVHMQFKPEFINRLDELVIFHPLTREELGGIVDIQVKQVASRLTDRRISLDVTDTAREWLANTGYDPAYGARPLRRLVQTEVGDQLARMLLAGQVHDGDTVLVDQTGGEHLALSVMPEDPLAGSDGSDGSDGDVHVDSVTTD